MLIIGLVCYALNATAEVKTVSSIGDDRPIIKIQKGEVGTCVFILRTTISIKTEKGKFDLETGTTQGRQMLDRYPKFKIAGPAEIKLEGVGILSVEIKPNEKH